MNQADIVAQLNQFFAVQNFHEGDFWLSLLPEVYKGTAQSFFVPEFWDGTWNGLMLDNARSDVDRVYLVVFPTANIMDTIIAKEVERGAPGSLIFTHHPLPFHEKSVGFSQIPIEQLEELREHQISLYNCHAPLDCHPEISTGTALANALGLNDSQRFAPYHGGLAGVYGTVPPVAFQQFADRVAEVCELEKLRYDQILHIGKPVHKVAIIPGGGDSQAFINEAMQLGADTYVTGHWHLFADNPYANSQRPEFETYLPSVHLNLIGASHYSSEMVVMRDQMKDWFSEKLELETVLIRQKEAWG